MKYKMEYFPLFLTFSMLLIGGIFYSVTGFGAALLLLPVLSLFMPILQVSAVAGFCALIISITIFWRFRHDVIWNKVLIPLPFFLVSGYIALKAGHGIRQDLLGILCGIFFIILGIWNLYGSKKSIYLPQKSYISIPLLSLCGVLSSWFSMSGPLLGLYFLSAAKEDKFHYIATLQAFTLFAAFGNVFTRIAAGVLTIDLIPYLAAGIIGIMIGQFIGIRILYRINIEAMKKIIISGLIIIGVTTVIRNILI